MLLQCQRTQNFFMSKAQIAIERYCCVFIHLHTTKLDKDVIWRPPYIFIWRPPYNFIWRPPYNLFKWRPPYKFMWRPPYKFIWRPPYNQFKWRPPYKLYGGRHLMTLYGGRQIKLFGGRHIICASNYYLMWHQSASVVIDR